MSARSAMFSTLFLLACGLLPVGSGQALLITEIQPVPNGEPEWIEVVNTTNKPLRIKEWLLCDARTCIRLPDESIPAHGTAVITRDVDGLREVRSIPTGVVIVEASLPSLNNSTEHIEIRDDDLSVVDSMNYDMKGFVKGRSIERFGVCNGDDSDGSENVEWSDEWRICVSSDSSTCGRFNSVISLPLDVRIAAMRILDASVVIDIVNHGMQDMRPVRVRCNAETYRVETLTPTLLAGESFQWEIPIAELGGYVLRNNVTITAAIDATDSRRSNNKLSRTVLYPPSPGRITLTEVMCDPWSTMKDYAEIYNNTQDTFDLYGWIIEDESGAQGVVATPKTLLPSAYAVLSASDDVRSMMKGALPTIIKPDVNWNIEHDNVILRTPDGFLVDAFSYDKSWHASELEITKGVSLEKRDVLMLSDVQSSWSSSGDLSGGTPGRKNSIDVNLSGIDDDASTLRATPEVFSSDRMHPSNPVSLSFFQPFRHAIASMSVFERTGRRIRSLMNSTFCGSTGAVSWDGTDETGVRALPGPYVVVMESVDVVTSNVNRSSCIVVVAE